LPHKNEAPINTHKNGAPISTIIGRCAGRLHAAVKKILLVVVVVAAAAVVMATTNGAGGVDGGHSDSHRGYRKRWMMLNDGT
jgi:hypothetical protein